MPDINDIHIFYELNLPGYTRKDIHKINKFFLEAANFPSNKPLKKFIFHFNDMKEFICFQWLGADEIITSKPVEVKREPEGPNDYTIMKYGKHAGEKFKDIPVDYFEWCYRNKKCSKEVKEYCIKKKYV